MKKIPKFSIKTGDCSELLSKAKSNYFGCVVTSPPYNVGKDYGEYYDDKKPLDAYLEGLDEMFYAVFRVLRPDGLFFLNIGNSHSDDLGPIKAHMVMGRALKMGFKSVDEVIWVKSITVPDENGGLRSIGHFTPVRGDRLNPMFEYVFIFAKNENYTFRREKLYVPYADKSNIGRYSETDGRCIGDVWFVAYKTTGKVRKKNHPTEFPVELVKKCIRLTKGPVLDPMCGGGAAGEAALRLGREFVGIEFNPEYADSAKERLDTLRRRILRKRKRKAEES